MYKIKVILFFLLVISRSSNGQHLIGDSIEFNAPGNYDDWEADNIFNDIWNEDDQTVSEEKSPLYTLESICTDYDLFYNGKLIDCENFKISHKKRDSTKNHQISKRDASEDNLEEGSGDDDFHIEDEKNIPEHLPFKTQSLDLSVEPNEETEPELQKLEPSENEKSFPKAKLEEKSQNAEPTQEELLKDNTIENTKPIQEAQSIEPLVLTPSVDVQENNGSVALDNIQTVGAEITTTIANEQGKQEQTVQKSEQEKDDINKSSFKTQSLNIPEIPESVSAAMPEHEGTTNLTLKPEEKEEVAVSKTQNVEPSEKVKPTQEELPKVEPVKNVGPIQEAESVDASELTPVAVTQENNGSVVLPSEDNIQPVGVEITTAIVNEQGKQEQTVETSKEENSDKSPFKTQSLNIPEISESVSNDTLKPEESKEVAVNAATKEVAPSETPKSEEAKTEVKQDLPTNEKPKTQEVANPQEPIVEKAIKDDKSELSETPVNVEESDNKKEEVQEEINPLQSGIAIVKTDANIGDTDKQLARSKPNESIKSTAVNAEEPKSGASESNETSKKNNTLLFIIFGAVLVVGAAAFGYNYYKKRSNRATAVSATEKRTSKTDPEEGREMKPLMKLPEENSSVEYKDEK